MNWWNKIFLFITILICFASGLSYAAMFVKPTTFWWISFFGLAYFPIFVLYLFFLLYWLFLKRKIFFILLLFGMLGYKAHIAYFGLQFNKNSVPSENASIKILTWNTKGLDAYNAEKPFENREKMIQVIADAKADIICLQEFNSYQNSNEKPNNFEEIKAKTGLQHAFFYKAYENKKKTRSFGLVIYSRYPILKTGRIEYETVSKLNTTIYADLEIQDTIVRIYATHLQSTQLTHKDLEFIQKSTESDSTDFDTERVVKKLNQAFQLRANQTDSIAKALQQTSFPKIICGDFNDTPVSYAYHKIAKDMEDAFLSCRFGIGSTFISLPILRIDYILFSKDDFDILHYQKLNTKTSDHYPVSAEFILK